MVTKVTSMPLFNFYFWSMLAFAACNYDTDDSDDAGDADDDADDGGFMHVKL